MEAQVVACVEAAAKRARPLQRCRLQLALDLLALLHGARHIIMLDYALGLQLKDLAPLLQQLHALLQQRQQQHSVHPGQEQEQQGQGQGQQQQQQQGGPQPLLQILTLDGCHYVAHLPATVAHLQRLCHGAEPEPPPSASALPAAGASAEGAAAAAGTGAGSGSRAAASGPVLVGFAKGGGEGVLSPEVLGPDKRQAVLSKLQPLLAALKARQQELAQGGSTSMPQDVLDMGKLKGLPLMPTLNGLLLGYPFVYVVEGGMREAQRASQCLSSTSLMLVQLRGDHPSVPAAWAAEAGGAAGAGGEGSSGAGQVLTAFSVPVALWSVQEGKEGADDGRSGSHPLAVQAWGARMTGRLKAGGWVHVGVVPQPAGIRAVSL